jgi:hypothetical protein
MQSKTEQLNSLFERWRQFYGESTKAFAEDGIINEVAWANASPKVLFLLKETNDYCGDLRKLIPKYWKGSWPNVGRWTYGIHKIAAGHFPSFIEASRPENYKSAGESSAIMNLKKLTGKDQSKMEEIRSFAQQDKDFIREEVDIIQPDIVVCGATFGIAKGIISGLDCKPIDPDRKCFKLGETVWIDYCHPTARFRHDMMYYTLIAIYQNYLKSIDKTEASVG